MSENPHADSYAPMRDNYARYGRGEEARHLRAEIAHEREHERPAHLPAWPDPWEDDYAGCFPHMQTIGGPRDEETCSDLAASISGMVYAPNGDHRFHADEARR